MAIKSPPSLGYLAFSTRIKVDAFRGIFSDMPVDIITGTALPGQCGIGNRGQAVTGGIPKGTGRNGT